MLIVVEVMISFSKVRVVSDGKFYLVGTLTKRSKLKIPSKREGKNKKTF